jgi:glutamate--cysteine ligase
MLAPVDRAAAGPASTSGRDPTTARTVLRARAHPRLATAAAAGRSSAVVGRRRLSTRAAAAANAAADAPPLTRDDLIAHLASGCKPPERWRIGTEHEKLCFNVSDLTRADYSRIALVFEKLEARYGWKPIVEGGKTIGVEMDGQSVTLEPGGQFELSGAPLRTLHQTCAEVNAHLFQVKSIGEEVGLAFLGAGFDPKWRVDQIPVMPKDRYRLMKSYMPTVGTKGLDMMFRTCTVQVNLDFESERDMREKFRIGLALQPVAQALFANSPFREGKLSGFLSTRGDVWTDVDKARTGGLPFVFDLPNFGFEHYVDYAMGVPMYFVYRKESGYQNALGLSWRDFMSGKLPCLPPGSLPTMADWENHLTTIFPDVRLKRFLEMRGADGVPFRLICALPALWVGLIYDAQAQAEALDLISDWSGEEREYLRREVPRTALATRFRKGTVRDVAVKVLEIARGGLERRGEDEAAFLGELREIAASGRTPADALVDLYKGRWNESVDPMFREMMY